VHIDLDAWSSALVLCKRTTDCSSNRQSDTELAHETVVQQSESLHGHITMQAYIIGISPCKAASLTISRANAVTTCIA
jgi:hypothetical protein